MKHWPFKVKGDENGKPIIEVSYKEENKGFSRRNLFNDFGKNERNI